ncbi:hypothetical protein KQX62_17915 [Rhodopseudomonas palustris]|uniref:Uncharacterized protein n=1 Tax=Rhodopseudomonas palustris TaxID=1076 RepID=A0AAX3DUP8_RHOPL|nr:hypothetical protein [Rhodopseudomonas palustris]UYO38577.1 hypothetical protein KQX62_17915 [Rhodopseudomonas palustris]
MRSFLIGLAALLIAAPAAAQKAADYELSCEESDTWCNISLKQFRKWYPLAWRGDYQGQRNIAFCLRDGCDGAIRTNPITGCAWRMVIVASGSPKVDSSDTLNLKTDCGKLDAVEREAASAQAARMLAKIQRR